MTIVVLFGTYTQSAQYLNFKRFEYKRRLDSISSEMVILPLKFQHYNVCLVIDGKRRRIVNMSIEAYWVSGSPYSWSVLLTLEVKGLTYQSKLLEVSKGETKTASFLKLNPLGQVPVLKDGDTVIYESLAIMAYLDRQYPDIPLFGEIPSEYGHIWQSSLEHVNYLNPILFKVIFPISILKKISTMQS